jgi:septum formation topological specificity factor MinE
MFGLKDWVRSNFLELALLVKDRLQILIAHRIAKLAARLGVSLDRDNIVVTGA